MQRVKMLAILLIGLLLLGVPVLQAQEPLALVNGDTISTADVDRVFATIHGGMSDRKKMNFDYRKLIDRLVNDQLIIQEAEFMGLDEESAFDQFLAEERRKNVSRRFVEDYYEFDEEIGDEEIEQFFDENYHRIQVRTIAVMSSAKADSLKELILAGASMDSLARKNSIDVHRYQGGAHSLKYYAEIENAIRDHLDDPEEGQLIGPVPYREAQLLIRVEEIAPADRDDLPALREYIRGILMSDLRKEHWQAFIDSLEEVVGVTRDQAKIAEVAATEATVLDSSFLSGGDQIVATVGGSASLTERELRTRTARIGMKAATAAMDSLVDAALNGWIQKEVLIQSGLKAGLGDDPRVAAALEKSRDSALVEIYLKETVVSQISFNRQELDQYYEEHKEDFRESDKLHLRRLIIYDKAKADSAYELLHEGSEFEFVADKFIAGDRRVVEKSEWVSLGAFPPELRDELNGIPVGDASRPIETPDGWIVFKVLGREEGRLKSPEEVELALREIAFQKQFEKLLDQTLDLLRENSEIVYYDEAIDRYLGDGQ